MKENTGNLRKGIGAMCIVLAMVLMAFVGFVQANSGNVSVSPDTGTRTETARMVSMTGDEFQATLDENGNILSQEQIEGMPTQVAANGVTALDDSTQEIVTPDGKMIIEIDRQMQRKEELLGSPNGEVTYGSDNGEIKVKTRTIPGYIDANGPYGGSDCFEGTCTIHFTVTPYDNPGIILFRWDWNADGIFDYPNQTGGGTIGIWDDKMEFDYTFFDNFYSDIIVQGWDGVSTYIVINTGTILLGAYNFNLT